MADDTTILADDGESVETADRPEVESTEDEAKDAAPAAEAEAPEEITDGEDETAEAEEPTAWEFSFAGSTLQIDKGQMPEDVAARVQEHLAGFQKHHTKTSQANAETRKVLEQQQRDIEDISNLQADVMDAYALARQAQSGLAQYQSIDMNALWQSDPDQARRLSDQALTLRQQYDGAIALANQKEADFREKKQAAQAERIREGVELMDRRIKDFSTKIAPRVVDYVVDKFGVDREAAENWGENPMTAEMAYKAMLYDEAQAKLKAPTKSEPPKPMSRPKGGSRTTAGPDPSKMSTEEWMKWRRSDLQKRGVRI